MSGPLGSVRLVELSHDIHEGMPVFPTHHPYSLLVRRRHRDLPRPDGYGSASDVMILSPQAGTHIDALGHGSENGRAYGGVAVEELEKGGRGLTRLDAASIPPIFRRAVLLDVASHLGRVMQPGEPVERPLAEQLARAAGLRAGDVVLVRTGWGAHYGHPGRYLGSEGEGVPGLTEQAAEWLCEQSVFAIGADTPLVEVSAPGNQARPVHRVCLVRYGVYLIENLNLDALAGLAAPFVFCALPLRIRGGTGSPIRAVALVGEPALQLAQALEGGG